MSTDSAINDDLRSRLKQIQSITESLGPEHVICHLYKNFFPIEPSFEVQEKLFELDRQLSDLTNALPELHSEFLALSTGLKLRDIDQVVLYATALRTRRGETLWFHYSLATILDVLLHSGLAAARAPCVLHSLLALLYRGEARHHEPLTRSIVAREVAELAPRDAIREGIEALALGYTPPYQTVLAAAASLGIVDGESHTQPSISLLEKIARRCALTTLRADAPVAKAADDSHLTVNEVVCTEQRWFARPKPDGYYYAFQDAEKEINVPSISVYDIPGGIISFDTAARGRTEFYVFDSNGRCLEDLSHGIRPFIQDDCYAATGPLAIAGDQFSGSMNLAHFLLDQLTRLAIYKRYLGHIPRFLLPGDYPYYRSVLSVAGLTEHALIPREQRFSIRSDRLLFASNVDELVHPAHLGAPWAFDFLRDLLPVGRDGGQHPGRKIFISRADARTRRIVNQELIERIVSRHGYEIMVLGGMTAREQMMTFADASHVVGVHGAGLTNVLFCAPGTRVLEILPPFCATNAYWILCSAASHRYHALIADDPELARPDYNTWAHRPEYNNRDVVMPAERFVAALDLLEHG